MNITTLQGFGESLKDPGEFTYSELIDTFESFMPDGNEGLVQRVFTRLVNLEGTDDRIEGITKRLNAWADETLPKIPLKNHQVLSAILPQLIKLDPDLLITLLRCNEEAKAVAMKLPGDSVGNSLFAIAEGISDWEAEKSLKFDKRFTFEQHEADYSAIERIHRWEKSTERTFDMRFTIEQHARNYTTIFERRLADWNESPAVVQKITEVWEKGRSIQAELDLRGCKTIPDVVGAIWNLQTLYVDEGVVLPRLPRTLELNLIATNPSLFQNIRSELKGDEQFIIDALNRNGAVLQFLPPELQSNRDFLLRTVEKAPGIIAHIHEDKDFLLSLVKAVTFGVEAWEKHFGLVGDVPPLPDNILEILSGDDPFSPGKKVIETHILFLLPAKVKGQPLNLNSFRELIKAPLTGNRSDYRQIWENITVEYGSNGPLKAQWILMTKGGIPNSLSQSYAEQDRVVKEKADYEIPDLLSAAVGIFTRYVKSGERLFADHTFTLTKTIVIASQIVIGNFDVGGPILHPTKHIMRRIGVAAMRRVS